MAQSDRNLVFHSGAKAHPPRQLRQQGHVEDQDRAVHRLLQRHHGQALPLDLRRKTSRRIAQPPELKNESLNSARIPLALWVLSWGNSRHSTWPVRSSTRWIWVRSQLA